MTSFVHIHYPEQHPGVARAEAVFAAAGRLRRGFDGTRGLAALLLAAAVSALLVVADRLVDHWTGGRLMAAWMVLWLVAFAALALFGGTARRLAVTLVKGLDSWSLRIAQSRADERLWATAQADPRVMSDLKAAIARSDVVAPRAAVALDSTQATLAPRLSMREIVQRWRADAARAQADAQVWHYAQSDHRVMAELQVAATHDEATIVPSVTQTLLRAEKAIARDIAFVRRARQAYYL